MPALREVVQHSAVAVHNIGVKKLLAIVILGFITVSAGVVFYIMNPPAPLIRIMNPTHFSSPEALGAILAERLYIDLRDRPEKVIALGINTDLPTSPAIWAAFQVELRKLGLDFAAAEPVEVATNLKSLTTGALRMVTAVPSHQEFRDQIKELPVIRFWTVPYSHLRSQKRSISEDCNFRAKSVSLECLSQRIENTYYRKRLEEDRYSAMLEKISATEYALYIYNPKAKE